MDEKFDRLSVYRELYHFEGSAQTLVIHEISQQVGLKKVLTTYQLPVFQYLKNHRNPHVVQVYDYEECGGTLTVIEEYLSGCTLEEYCRTSQPGVDEILSLLEQLCDGLVYLQSAQPPIIHRDIKASNLMVNSDHILKIIDFDAAKPHRDAQARDTILIGTEGYAAPEQYGFGSSDCRTDIYAAGVLMRNILPPGTAADPVIRKATQIDPDRRYANAAELKQAIHRLRYPGHWRRGERGGRQEKMDQWEEDGGQGTGSLPETGQRRNVPHRLLPLPGFRSGVLWKKIVALLGYPFLILCNTQSTFQNIRGAGDAALNHLFLAMLTVSCLDILTDWSGIAGWFPGYYHPAGWVRWLCRTAEVFLTGVVLIGILVSLENALWPV